MFAMGVDVGRFFKGLWTGVKQPPLGSTYDPEITLALDEMELDGDLTSPQVSPSSAVPAE